MRELTFVEPGRVEWRDVPEPELVDRDAALVRPLAVARCDIDRPMATDGIFPGPFAVGHEMVAEIVAVGDGVAGRHAGEKVLVPFQVSCGSCPACRGRRFGGCRTHRARIGAAFGFGASGGGHGGGMADLLVVPAAAHMLLPLPAGIDDPVAATLPDNVVDGYRTVGPYLAAYPEADVLVVGGFAPSVGLYAVAAAVALGVSRVRYVDSDAERCGAAEALGAAVEQRDGPWPRSFERALITVENTGTVEGLAATLRSTEAYGVCTSVAIHDRPATAMPLLEMYTRGVTFHASRADSRRNLPAVVELVTAGRLRPLDVPTTVVPWEEADRCWLTPATKLVVSRSR